MSQVRPAVSAILAAALTFASQSSESGAPPPSRPSGHGTLRLGFNVSQANGDRLIDALNRLRTDNIGFYLPNYQYIQPYQQVLSKVSLIYYGTSSQYIGYTNYSSGRHPIFVYNGAYEYNSPMVLMEVILHESDHHRYGSHSCGSGADADDNGPYGVEAYYGLKLYWGSQSLDASQRNYAASWALGRAYDRMCGNGAAINRVFNAWAYNQFPPGPPPPGCYYDESGQLVCPPVCYLDESGQVVCV